MQVILRARVEDPESELHNELRDVTINADGQLRTDAPAAPSGGATETTLASILGRFPALASLSDALASEQVTRVGSYLLGWTGLVHERIQSVGGALKVAIQGTVPLPTGAAQDTTVAAVRDRLPTSLGQKAATASLSVIEAADSNIAKEENGWLSYIGERVINALGAGPQDETSATAIVEAIPSMVSVDSSYSQYSGTSAYAGLGTNGQFDWIVVQNTNGTDYYLVFLTKGGTPANGDPLLLARRLPANGECIVTAKQTRVPHAAQLYAAISTTPNILTMPSGITFHWYIRN